MTITPPKVTEEMQLAFIEAKQASTWGPNTAYVDGIAAVLAIVERDYAAKGYDRAVAVLTGVWARSGSPAARWAADYLAADPDRWRHAQRCSHSAECSGGGPDCQPERTGETS